MYWLGRPVTRHDKMILLESANLIHIVFCLSTSYKMCHWIHKASCSNTIEELMTSPGWHGVFLHNPLIADILRHVAKFAATNVRQISKNERIFTQDIVIIFFHSAARSQANGSINNLFSLRSQRLDQIFVKRIDGALCTCGWDRGGFKRSVDRLQCRRIPLELQQPHPKTGEATRNHWTAAGNCNCPRQGGAHRVRRSVCACVRACVRAYVRACVRACACARARVRVRVCVCVRARACARARTCVCVRVICFLPFMCVTILVHACVGLCACYDMSCAIVKQIWIFNSVN